MSASGTPHVVIVGAGFAGLRVAKRLASAPVRITVIDRSNHHLFQPLLYQVATAGLSPADIASPIRAILRRQKNTEVLMDEVIGVDRASKQVLLKARSVSYDYLVLATGARHSYFGRDEWESIAPGLKTIEDATTIRRRILLAFEAAEAETDPKKRDAHLTFVIVGGGPTGVELAGSIAELAHKALKSDFRHIDPKSTKILLLEAGPRLLAAFSEKISQSARDALVKLGVDVRTGGRVEKIDEDSVLVSGQIVPAKTVIWAAGVVASPAARWLGIEADRSGRAKVLRDLTIPGDRNIFVIGDTSAATDQDGKPLPGVAPVAMQQGQYVAKAIKSRFKGRSEQAPFRYVDKGNMATIGRAFAVAEFKKLRISGFSAWIAWIAVHIFYLIGFRNRILVLIEWAWAYLTFQRGARLITEPGRAQVARPAIEERRA